MSNGVKNTVYPNSGKAAPIGPQQNIKTQVIKQGQIQEMVLKGETSFLDMLREVTGTRVFEEKI